MPMRIVSLFFCAEAGWLKAMQANTINVTRPLRNWLMSLSRSSLAHRLCAALYMGRRLRQDSGAGQFDQAAIRSSCLAPAFPKPAGENAAEQGKQTEKAYGQGRNAYAGDDTGACTVSAARGVG